MIVLGVDGGGTKTHALAVNEHGQVVGVGISKESNYQVSGLKKAIHEIADATRQALGTMRPDKAVFCLAGCDTDLDEMRLIQAIADLGLVDDFVCYTDVFAALRAGTQHPFGVAVICGTGFNACGIAPDGRRIKLRSLGELTGDWGGGHSLGEAVSGAVYRAEDGRGEPTMLTSMMMETLGILDLSTFAYRITDDEVTPSQISLLAPLVFEAAERGDRVAQSILVRQADEIVVSALAMLRRLDMLQLEVDVILSGGVIQGNSWQLIKIVTERIMQQCPKAHVCRLEIPPVTGAALLAFDACNVAAPTIKLEGNQLSISYIPTGDFD
jgi:N-acetylglucosamine kinase-like BadF-type ATPase